MEVVVGKIWQYLIGTLEVALDHGYAKLLHEKAIKQCILVHLAVWHARGIVTVVLWYMIKRLDDEKYLSFFENSSRAAAKGGN